MTEKLDPTTAVQTDKRYPITRRMKQKTKTKKS